MVAGTFVPIVRWVLFHTHSVRIAQISLDFAWRNMAKYAPHRCEVTPYYLPRDRVTPVTYNVVFGNFSRITSPFFVLLHTISRIISPFLILLRTFYHVTSPFHVLLRTF